MSAGLIGPLQLQTRTSGVAELRKECLGGGSRPPIVLAFVELEGLTGRLLSIDRFPSHPEDAGQLHPHRRLGLPATLPPRTSGRPCGQAAQPPRAPRVMHAPMPAPIVPTPTPAEVLETR